MEDMIIFSAGEWGEHAYVRFRKLFNILYFVDNDSKRWGEQLFGVKITSPDIIASCKESVIVVANQYHYDAIINQILENYGARRIIPYRMNEYTTYYGGPLTRVRDDDDCEAIVEFDQGIGGMLYQYAFLLYLRKKGVNVLADFSYYHDPLISAHERRLGFYDPEQFLVDFKSIIDDPELRECNPRIKLSRFMNRHRCFFASDYYFADPEDKSFDYNTIYKKYNLFRGVSLPFELCDTIRSDILSHIRFPVCEKKLLELSERIVKENYVSVHVRRGDYLATDMVSIYGGICTKEYYDNAIEFIHNHVNDAKFVFFSNDIEWVKTEMRIDEAIYIERNLFEEYRDWYDLYLTSICKHNITANSQFSRWGAWINSNPDKIVITPRESIRGKEFKAPNGWVSIGPD